MGLTVSIISLKFVNYLGGLDWTNNAGLENRDGINFIDYLSELDWKINTD